MYKSSYVSKQNYSYEENVSSTQTNRPGYNLLNPHVYSSYFDKSFQKVSDGYISNDPRTASVPLGGAKMPLDVPPIYKDVDLRNINFDEGLDNYGKGYKTYSDINVGQVLYYVNNSTANTLFEPLFSPDDKITLRLYEDPMGTVKPEYTRDKSKSKNCCGNSRWLQDTQAHRQDLLDIQMRRNNSNRWAPLYNK